MNIKNNTNKHHLHDTSGGLIVSRSRINCGIEISDKAKYLNFKCMMIDKVIATTCRKFITIYTRFSKYDTNIIPLTF